MCQLLDFCTKNNFYCSSVHDSLSTTWCQIGTVSNLYQKTLENVLQDPIAIINDMVLSSFAAIIPASFVPAIKDIASSKEKVSSLQLASGSISRFFRELAKTN
jgi:hypothetical protein